MITHSMSIMGKTGHTVMNWDKQSTADIRAAATMFDELLGKGYRAFRAGDGDKDGIMKSFDPDATEIVMAVPLVGG